MGAEGREKQEARCTRGMRTVQWGYRTQRWSIKVAPYEAFSSLRFKFGDERAAEVVRFQMRHVDVLVDLCEKDETVDVFLDGNAFEEKKRKVQDLKEPMPEVKIQLWEEKEAREVRLHPPVAAFLC